MSHPNDDQLLLHAYGEAGADGATLDEHLAGCADCRARFTRLEESRVALEWGMDQRQARGGRRLVWLALPIAAGLGALLLVRAGFLERPTARPSDRPVWQTHLVGSPTAGYVAGGAAFISIDSQLTDLEQERIHGSLEN